MQSIILVDDEDHFRERLARAFSNRGYTVYEAGEVDQALEMIKDKHPDWALIDLRMPGKSGLDLIKEAKKFLPKPADVDDILNAFERDSDLPADPEQVEFEVPSLARAEWEHIQRVLNDCDNNITAAAQKLGIHRRTLQRKLYKYAPKK